jgi:hypothetical protein
LCAIQKPQELGGPGPRWTVVPETFLVYLKKNDGFLSANIKYESFIHAVLAVCGFYPATYSMETVWGGGCVKQPGRHFDLSPPPKNEVSISVVTALFPLHVLSRLHFF